VYLMRTVRELLRTLAYLLAYSCVFLRTLANSCVSARVFLRIRRELSRTLANSRELSEPSLISCELANHPRTFANLRELLRTSCELLANFLRTLANFLRTFANFRISGRELPRIRRELSRTFCELSRTLAYFRRIRETVLSTASSLGWRCSPACTHPHDHHLSASVGSYGSS